MLQFSLSKRERYIFIITIAAIVLGLAYGFIFEPILKKWEVVNKQIVIKETKIKKGIKLLKERNTIIKDYNTYAESFRNISKILNYVEKQSEVSGIKTFNISPRPVNEKELYREYIIEVQVEGSFPAINRFISELTKFPVFISLEKLELNTVTGETSNFKGTLVLSKIII